MRGKTRGNKLLFQPLFDGATGKCGPRRPHIFPGSSPVQNIFSGCYLLVAVAGQCAHGDLFQAIATAAKTAHLAAYYAAPPTDTGTVMAATPQQLQAYSSVWPSAA
jgi:hypothetical protein